MYARASRRKSRPALRPDGGGVCFDGKSSAPAGAFGLSRGRRNRLFEEKARAGMGPWPYAAGRSARSSRSGADIDADRTWLARPREASCGSPREPRGRSIYRSCICPVVLGSAGGGTGWGRRGGARRRPSRCDLRTAPRPRDAPSPALALETRRAFDLATRRARAKSTRPRGAPSPALVLALGGGGDERDEDNPAAATTAGKPGAQP